MFRRDRRIFIFPVQLTTSRIGNRTRLIHTLLYVMTIHTYMYIRMPRLLSFVEVSDDPFSHRPLDFSNHSCRIYQLDESELHGAVLNEDESELYVSGNTKGIIGDFDGDGKHSRTHSALSPPEHLFGHHEN